MSADRGGDLLREQDHRQTGHRGCPDPQDRLGEAEMPGLEREAGERSSDQDKGHGPEQRTPSAPVVAQPAQRERGECCQPGESQKEAHLARGEI